jgi:hypothetical protein
LPRIGVAEPLTRFVRIIPAHKTDSLIQWINSSNRNVLCGHLRKNAQAIPSRRAGLATSLYKLERLQGQQVSPARLKTLIFVGWSDPGGTTKTNG